MHHAVADVIRADHREFERLFGELRDPMKRSLQAPTLVALLAAHARAEEAHVYPALRQDTDAGDQVEHSQEEHAEADGLAEQLIDHDLDDPTFDRLLGQLVDAVRHHLEEEEESVLPALESLSTQHQTALARDFLETRARHLCFGTIDLTKAELQMQATNQGIEGGSRLSKEALKQSVRSSSED